MSVSRGLHMITTMLYTGAAATRPQIEKDFNYAAVVNEQY